MKILNEDPGYDSLYWIWCLNHDTMFYDKNEDIELSVDDFSVINR